MARIRKTYFTKSKMGKLLGVNEKQHEVYMPNEIFENLTEAFTSEEMQGKTSTHIAYAYTYYYLANYQWRYARYYYYDDKTGMETSINEGIIKQILGFPSKSEQYTYLTKNNTGLLVKLGYIRKETDKPSRYWYDDEGKYKEVQFVYESEYPELYGNNKNWKVAMPVKGFYRYKESEEDNYEDGTFYMIQNTHMIDIDVFIYCMADLELGVEGFYLYCFLKFMTDKYDNAYNCSQKKMAQTTRLSIDEVKKQLENLEKRNMITSDHKPFCLDKPADKETKTNTYGIKEPNEFAKSMIQFNVIPKQRKITAKQYESEVGWANEKEINGLIINQKTGEIIKSSPVNEYNINDEAELSDLDEVFSR
ncbi:hypothetical protein [Paenibacillus aquistagni]|uniref:Uncharacterized protein n=1 Tax=Paenibacillus aquistagni TaxID=1852522 RepID=A0A1X7LEC9_9BACL|nr:hypothetical protein [Paenibacillus aquistagni]SMG52216.1 hypothetical protein SAMN06295960_3371 [Paenibacillus aquistagni]